MLNRIEINKKYRENKATPKKKRNPPKFYRAFNRYSTTYPEYYAIAFEYKKRLGKHITELSLADRVYSDYIKITKSANGWCKCVTSGIVRRWDNPSMQNGHFHLRADYKYRFMDVNCRPQSKEDNVFKNGNYVNYVAFIANELFGGDHQQAIDMFNDPEFVIISKQEQRKLVVEKWYPKIQECKKILKIN